MDYYALSFVRNADVIYELKRWLSQKGGVSLSTCPRRVCDTLSHVTCLTCLGKARKCAEFMWRRTPSYRLTPSRCFPGLLPLCVCITRRRSKEHGLCLTTAPSTAHMLSTTLTQVCSDGERLMRRGRHRRPGQDRERGQRGQPGGHPGRGGRRHGCPRRPGSRAPCGRGQHPRPPACSASHSLKGPISAPQGLLPELLLACTMSLCTAMAMRPHLPNSAPYQLASNIFDCLHLQQCLKAYGCSCKSECARSAEEHLIKGCFVLSGDSGVWRAGAVLAEQDRAGVPQARQARHRGHQHAGVHDWQPHAHPRRGEHPALPSC